MRQCIPNGSAPSAANARSKSSAWSSTPSSRNSVRMKKAPPSGSVECWSDCTMFAPRSRRNPDSAATMPRRSTQDTSSRPTPSNDGGSDRTHLIYQTSDERAWRVPASSAARSTPKLLERLPAPALRALQFVEGVEVEAPDVRGGIPVAGREPADQRVGLERPHHERPQPRAVGAQEARGLAETDPHRDSQQLRVVDDAGQADPDRQARSARAHPRDPGADSLGFEADLTDDVGRHRRLLEHRLDRRLVADQVMALRIAGDAELREAAAHVVHRRQQLGRAVEPPGLLRVSGRHEYFAHARGA